MNQYAQITKSQLLQATYDLLRLPSMPDALKKNFLNNITIQLWSENLQTKPNSKIIGNRYMSEDAYKHYMRTKSKSGLHHEHVTTKNLIYKKHFATHFMDVELDEIEYWMDSCAFACVVTYGDNDKYLKGRLKQNMPDEFYDPNHSMYMKKWARYLKAGFTDIWEVEWDEHNIPKKIGRPNFNETI